jgi:hypothetical protein
MKTSVRNAVGIVKSFYIYWKPRFTAGGYPAREVFAHRAPQPVRAFPTFTQELQALVERGLEQVLRSFAGQGSV